MTELPYSGESVGLIISVDGSSGAPRGGWGLNLPPFETKPLFLK